MADNYLEALQRKTNPTRNMKGVPVEVETDIGLEKKINPQLEALFRQKLMSMDPKLVNQLKRRVANAFPDMEENKRQINKAFNMRARENQKRTESIMSDKEEQLKLMKRAEIAEQKEIERKAEKKADKEASKKERNQEKRDSMKLDFAKLRKDQSIHEGEIQILKDKIPAIRAEYIRKYATYDDNNQPELDAFYTQQMNNEITEVENKIDAKITKYNANRDYELNQLFEKANEKYPGNLPRVAQEFQAQGLEEDYIKLFRQMKSIQKSKVSK